MFSHKRLLYLFSLILWGSVGFLFIVALRPIPVSQNPQSIEFSAKSVESLHNLFQQHRFHLRAALEEKRPIPRIYLSRFPKDWKKETKNFSRPQYFFIQVALPLILKINEQVLGERHEILKLQEDVKQGYELTFSQKQWLAEIKEKYRANSIDFEELLRHVDIVPASLALAQAALETGWGRSSAAVNKNSIFGHMKNRSEVARYETLKHSVESYIQNLNRHHAYAGFRLMREDMHKKNLYPLSGIKLASELKRYSTRGIYYIMDVQNLIRQYKLERFNTLKLQPVEIQKKYSPFQG